MKFENYVARRILLSGIYLLAAATITVAQADRGNEISAASAAPNAITSTTIPPQLFGMSAHDGVLGGDPWPTMPITGLRLWDADVAWAQINTAKGVYDWTTLDEWITAAGAHNDQLIYTFGQTPAWASSNAKDASCDYSPGSCWPPSDLNSDGTGTDQHFIDFVTAIAQHAPSITYWEMWNTPHDPNQWNGTDAQLVRMTQDARTYIQKYIPSAKIISPANGQLNYSYPNGNCTMADKMGGYLAAGLGNYIDILALHTYYTTVPENIVPVIQCYQSIMATYNVSSLPLWSTEGAWGTNSELPSTKDEAGFLARLYLLLWSNGVVRHYWYAWNDVSTGTLEVSDNIVSPGTAYTQVESWMSGRTMSTLCSEGSSGIWTCGFTGSNGYESQAVWHPGGNKTYTAPSQYINYLDLSGTLHTISSGAKVTAGVEPILLQNQSSTSKNPGFLLSETSPFPDVKAGSTGTTGSITISSENGFTAPVALSCSATFGANSCSISPTSVSVFPATATLVINGTSFSPGTYEIAVQGTSGSTTNTYQVPFNVSDFSIAGPATLSSASAGPVAANLTVTSLYTYNGQINATCDASALPGAVCTLSPANPIAIGNGAAVPVVASITIATNATPGAYNIGVNMQDVSGTPSHSLTVALAVNPVVQDFSLGSLTPASQTINPGQSASYSFSVLPVGTSFSSAVNLSCSGGPALSKCSFNPSSVTPGTTAVPVVMTITTTAASAGLLPQPRRGPAIFYAIWLALPAFVLLAGSARPMRRRKPALTISISVLGVLLLALLLASCGRAGTPSSAGSLAQQPATQAGTYTLTVTGASGTITHKAPAVTLVVN